MIRKIYRLQLVRWRTLSPTHGDGYREARSGKQKIAERLPSRHPHSTDQNRIPEIFGADRAPVETPTNPHAVAPTTIHRVQYR